MSLTVVKPGLLSTIQDAGRFGSRKYGVISSGPMDPVAFRAANLLVGNDDSAAVLEMTMQGAEFHANETVLAAICGADMQAQIDGRRAPLWRPFVVPQGSILRFQYAVSGCRTYLAVAEGFAVDTVMSSRSTYLRAGLGGIEGRALRAGDELRTGSLQAGMKGMELADGRHRGGYRSEGLHAVPWSLSFAMLPAYSDAPVIRFVRSKETSYFTEESLDSFKSGSYQVSSQSDRMGYRLTGPKLSLAKASFGEMISEAVSIGTIQVPPDGQPILLMADCQTTGGYPRIGHVISADIPLAAQVKPGGFLRFEEVSLRAAQELLLWQELDLRTLRAGVRARLRDAGSWGRELG